MRTCRHGRRLAVLLAIPLAGAVALSAGQKPKSGKAYALIAGTTFRDPGFAMSGVEIQLQPRPTGKTSVKVKRMKTVSDERGEYGFRVPAAEMKYELTFTAQGFETVAKEVTIGGEERQDIYVTLKPRKEEAQ